MITPDHCYNVQAQVPIIAENNNLQSHVKLIPKNRGFKIACLNITSLHKHIDELRICLNDREVDILAINETTILDKSCCNTNPLPPNSVLPRGISIQH